MTDQKFGAHKPESVRPSMGGVRHVYKFVNGFGASVVRHEHSYGGRDGLWELAVLKADGRLTYDTPVTNDVLGHQTVEEITAALDQIAALPAGAEVTA